MLQLTFREKDVLATISGVAKKTEHFKRGNSYPSGTWQDNLRLCWMSFWLPTRDESQPIGLAMRIYIQSFLARTKEWAAPSWSWASIDGAVSYQSVKFNGDVAIFDTSFWEKKCDVNEATSILAVKMPLDP